MIIGSFIVLSDAENEVKNSEAQMKIFFDNYDTNNFTPDSRSVLDLATRAHVPSRCAENYIWTRGYCRKLIKSDRKLREPYLLNNTRMEKH